MGILKNSKYKCSSDAHLFLCLVSVVRLFGVCLRSGLWSFPETPGCLLLEAVNPESDPVRLLFVLLGLKWRFFV